MKTTLKRARPAAKVVAGKSVETATGATQKPARKSAATATKPSLSTKKSTPATATNAKLSAKKPAAAKAKTSPEKLGTLFDGAAAETPTKTKLETKPAALRATKKRAPKDLANQYGEIVQAARAPVINPAPRKRRNAATRAKLQAVIVPDDGLLQRLARAGAISTSHVSKGENGSDDKPFGAVVKRRSRKWETRCGKCGVNAQYSTAAALCVKCGAILVRD